MGEGMTAGELKVRLASVPDDYVIVAHDAGDPSVGIHECTYDIASGVTIYDPESSDNPSGCVVLRLMS